MATVRNFILGGSKITADGDGSHEIKRCLLLGRKVYQPRQHIKKQRHYFANKDPSSQSYDFSSGHVMDVRVGLWRKLSTAELMLLTVVLEKTFENPWTTQRSNQCILKEIGPGSSLEGMMLKLKFQYFVHLMWRVDSLEKPLMLGGIRGRRRKGR